MWNESIWVVFKHCEKYLFISVTHHCKTPRERKGNPECVRKYWNSLSYLNESWLLELVLQEEEVVCGCHGDYILRGMPCCVEDFLIKVQAVDKDLIFFALATGAHLENIPKIRYIWAYGNQGYEDIKRNFDFVVQKLKLREKKTRQSTVNINKLLI